MEAAIPSPSLQELKVLYQSKNYIVVDKNFDLKINSDDDTDKVTVATQLAEKFPDLADDTIAHKFR